MIQDFSRLDHKDLIEALECTDNEFISDLHQRAYDIKLANVGNKVYLRGLIEISNICVKNCFYCGIRHDNSHAQRYEIDENIVVKSAEYAYNHNFASVVIQGGERKDSKFIDKITRIIKEIKKLGDGALGITLSLGEQPESVYKEWFDAGAHRYLLRIESSNPNLYRTIHPNDPLHSYDRRMNALFSLKQIGYQAGTGVMIGFPFQTVADMASDLLFFKEFDAPMIGMGPYIPHQETPLTQMSSSIAGAEFPSNSKRLELSLKMISLLRILMPDINIAATTALEVLSHRGREQAILAGANIVMPNITPDIFRENYTLYENKPFLLEDINLEGAEIGYGEWGDSKHFLKTKQKDN